MLTLTTEVVIEPSHQVERCFLFRGAHAPCSLRHPMPDTTPRFTPVLMETMRGHSQQPPEEVTLALAPALASSQHVFFLVEMSLKSPLERRTPRMTAAKLLR